jgi:hypothetical protein
MAMRSARSRSTLSSIRCCCLLLALALEFELAPVISARAQQVQVLPSQQRPPAGNVARNQPQSSQEQTIPSQPAMPVNPGSNMREIPLPVVFKGCWAGEVSVLDSMVPLTPAATHVQWLTKLYTLCYQQVGAGDRWHLTFAETSVAQRSMVTDQRQSISVTSVDGQDRAELTGYLHFRAPQLSLFGMATGAVNTLDELTQLHCTVTPDHDAMNVRADVLVENNDEPWVKITWHTRLLRTEPSPTN